jgi:hypothetical protein
MPSKKDCIRKNLNIIIKELKTMQDNIFEICLDYGHAVHSVGEYVKKAAYALGTKKVYVGCHYLLLPYKRVLKNKRKLPENLEDKLTAAAEKELKRWGLKDTDFSDVNLIRSLEPGCKKRYCEGIDEKFLRNFGTEIYGCIEINLETNSGPLLPTAFFLRKGYAQLLELSVLYPVGDQRPVIIGLNLSTRDTGVFGHWNDEKPLSKRSKIRKRWSEAAEEYDFKLR